MYEETISLLSMWTSFNSWLTPTILFLLLNLMIATIAFTSTTTTTTSNHHNPAPLGRSPSVLQRLKSLSFYSYIHSPPPPIHLHHQPPPLSTALAPEYKSPPAPSHEEENGPTMDEVYKLIVKKGGSAPYGRQNSDTKPSCGEVPVKLPRKMKKSASHKSPFSHFKVVNANTPTVEREKAAASAVAAGGGGDAGVDAKADDFINKFKKQLQLQRLESLVRYKNMITRGSVC